MIIIILFIIIFLYLVNKEKFTNFGACENSDNISSIKYELVDEDTMNKIKDSLSRLSTKKISYSCPDPNSKSAQGPPGAAVKPKIISGKTFGFDPEDIDAIDQTLGTQIVKTVNANGKSSKVVSNVDLIPLLITYIKMQKMGGSSAAEKAARIEEKLSELESTIRDIDKWKNSRN